ATVHAALEAGITFFNTADTFAPNWDTMGHNEKIAAEALRTWSGDASQVVVATKGGITRGAGGRSRRDRPGAYLRSALQKSPVTLETAPVAPYTARRPGRSSRDAEGVQTLAALREAGLIREIGTANANLEEM